MCCQFLSVCAVLVIGRNATEMPYAHRVSIFLFNLLIFSQINIIHSVLLMECGAVIWGLTVVSGSILVCKPCLAAHLLTQSFIM